MRVNTVIFVLQMFRVPASERSDNLSERQAGIQSCPLRRGLWTQAVSGAGQQIQNTTCTAHRANSCTVGERLHAFCLLANHVFTVHHAMTTPEWWPWFLSNIFKMVYQLRTFTVYESLCFMLALDKNVLMCVDLQLLDRDDSHQDETESPNARSPLHLAVSLSLIHTHTQT